MSQYLLTITRRPRHTGELPAAHVEPYRGDKPFKRGPLSASMAFAEDVLTMHYGCEGMSDVRRCLADAGRRCDFLAWENGSLDQVTFAEGVDRE
jgi:hypothetical protein